MYDREPGIPYKSPLLSCPAIAPAVSPPSTPPTSSSPAALTKRKKTRKKMSFPKALEGNPKVIFFTDFDGTITLQDSE